MKVRYRYRIYPTSRQQQHLAQVFGCTRYVYNWALRLRSDAYRNGTPMNYNATSAALTELKKQPETVWLNDVSCVPTQQALRHLQTAFKNFYDKRTRYPSFKKKSHKQSAEYTRSAFKYDAQTQSLTVSGLGELKARWSRPFQSAPTTATITKLPDGRYFVTLCLDEEFETLPKTGEGIGLDLGINRLATLSNGERVANPRYTAKYAKRLARAQRLLARKQKGSKRRDKQRLKVARLHAKIADCRKDVLHKFTTDTVRRFDLICIEDLNVRGMVRNHCLAKSLSDASFGAVRSMLGYKCARYGKTLVEIDRFFPSSKTCHACGLIIEKLPLDVREWTCQSCNATHDRDLNAAKNIFAVGQTENQNARGELVRHKVTPVTLCATQ